MEFENDEYGPVSEEAVPTGPVLVLRSDQVPVCVTFQTVLCVNVRVPVPGADVAESVELPVQYGPVVDATLVKWVLEVVPGGHSVISVALGKETVLLSPLTTLLLSPELMREDVTAVARAELAVVCQPLDELVKVGKGG